MVYRNSRRASAGQSSRKNSGSSSRNSGGRRYGGRRSGGRNSRGPKKQTIHPSQFVKAAEPHKEEKYKPQHTFADFKVVELLAKNIAKKGFEKPSPIQDQSIPIALKGKDVIGIANTGTGKTIAFGVPVINHLLSKKDSRAIIMAPTRELAHQIKEELDSLIVGSSIKSVLLIGGAAMYRQVNKLKLQPQLVIGTPGRIKDHLEKKKLKLQYFDTVVLDEVDRMLDMGFVHDMRAILGRLPHKRQSLFYSATMDNKVKELIKEFSENPETVSVKTSTTSNNVDQDVVRYKTNEDKIEKLHEILAEQRDAKVIIFDEMKYSVSRLAQSLVRRGFKADAIHGDKTQGQRQRALQGFKDGKNNVLVATDVAARGIDVEGVALVINYSTPQTYDDYAHRIGRVGRAGKTGKALTFITGNEGRGKRRSR